MRRGEGKKNQINKSCVYVTKPQRGREEGVCVKRKDEGEGEREREVTERKGPEKA